MVSERTLEEIRLRMNIVDLVSEYVQLKKSGTGFQGLCPFHKEKTPSFQVSPHKQIFHCFGCQKGGNVFTFLCLIEGIRFPEAIKKLADKTGVTLEEDKKFTSQKPQIAVGNPDVLKALEWTAKYYHHLLTESKEYASVLQYVKSRGLSDRTIDKFQIGASPKGWDTLIKQMAKRNIPFSTLVQAGLVVEKEGSSTKGYDRFRERLMFPIRNPEGHVVAFGARILGKQDDQPKYINSPATPFFPKRKLLYGFFENQRGVRTRNEAILVEGYMDVVGLYEKGVENAVATMGTALTADHCLFLKQSTRKVVTVFDADRAGQDAWHRSVHLFLSHGIFAKDLTLPDNLDPDEYVMKEGEEKFFELCRKAPRQITKFLKEIAAQGPLSEEDRSSHLEKLVPILMATKRSPDRAILWDDISLVLGISLNALNKLVEEGGPNRAAQPSSGPTKNTAPAKRSGPDSKTVPTAFDPIDLECFKACLKSPTAFLGSKPGEWVPSLRDAKIQHLLEGFSEAKNVPALEILVAKASLEEEDSRLASLLTSSALVPAPKEDSPRLEAILGRLKDRKKQQEIQSLTTQIRLAQKLGDPKEESRLLSLLRELRTS